MNGKYAFVVCVLMVGGCAGTSSNLPSFPIQTVTDPPQETFAGPGKCRVRVEPIVFDAATTWGGQPESVFIASLRPQAQQSHAADKPTAADFYLKHLALNERDYLKGRGTVRNNPGGDEPLVVRSRVLAVDTKIGLVAVHEIIDVPSGRKVGEFRVTSSGIGYGLGMQLRAAAVGQAMTVLKYFADRFSCNEATARSDS